MAKPILSDELWDIIEPLLPPPKPRRYRHPGRYPIGDRETLTGILFVLKTGILREELPQEMGCGSGMTWSLGPDPPCLADKIDWSRASVDSASVRAVGAGEKAGRTNIRGQGVRLRTS